MIAKHADDKSLKLLSHLCRALDAIACPILLGRIGIKLSRDLVIGPGSYKGLPIFLRWCQSDSFFKMNAVYCSFSRSDSEAHTELEELRMAFRCLPPGEIFRSVVLADAPILVPDTTLLTDMLLTMCTHLDIEQRRDVMEREDFVSFQPSEETYLLRRRNIFQRRNLLERTKQGTNIRAAPIKPCLYSLNLRLPGLTSKQWYPLLGSIDIPTLQRLTLDGNVPMAAAREILSRHPSIRSFGLTSESKISSRTPRLSLALPGIFSISGTLQHLTSLLGSLSLPADPDTLFIKPNRQSEMVLPSVFVGEILSCEALCASRQAEDPRQVTIFAPSYDMANDDGVVVKRDNILVPSITLLVHTSNNHIGNLTVSTTYALTSPHIHASI